jgi:hypothetical protein
VTDFRLALVVEGSEDAKAWKPYVFAYHHGPEDRAPSWVAPFHPRLDWQLSQAAEGTLKDPRTQRWFLPLMFRLFQGEEAVTRHLANNPFPDQPPRFLRVLVFNYEFTTGSERRSSGAWWRRQFVRVYCPAVTANQIRGYLQRLPVLTDGEIMRPETEPKREMRRPRSQPSERRPPPRPPVVDSDGFVTE